MPECAYHAEKTATSKCARCNRPICDEDKKEISSGKETGSSGTSNLYYTFCIPCWAEKGQKLSMMGYGFLFSGIASLIPQIYYFNWDVTPEKKIWTVSWLFASAIFILVGKQFITNGKRTLKERMTIRNRFLKTVDKDSFIVREGVIIQRCHQCNRELAPKNMFCPSCGFSPSDTGG